MRFHDNQGLGGWRVADGRTGRGRGSAAGPATLPLQRRPPSQEACPQRPRGPGLHLAVEYPDMKKGLLNGSSAVWPQDASLHLPKQPYPLPSHKLWCKASRPVKTPVPPLAAVRPRASHFPSLGLSSDRQWHQAHSKVVRFSCLEVVQRPGMQAAPVEYTWAIMITASDRLR